MASGVDDSAKTIYYSNINYNGTTTPITSYKNNQLQSRFLQNQTNYQVSINKLKISSLEGIILSYLPFEEWEMGLKISDAAGTPHTASAFVSLPNEQGTVDYFEYFSFINQETNQFELYKNSKTTTILELSFTPLDAIDGNTVYPNYGFYDGLNSRFWAVDYTNIYLYDATGAFLTSKALTSIAYASLENTTGNLLIVESYVSPLTNKLTVWNYSSDAITAIGSVRNNHAGDPFTFLQCCASDGSTIILSYLNNNITTASATTYDTIADSILTGVNQICNILIDTANNDFIIADNRYIPNICANTDNTPGNTSINLKSLFTPTPGQILETSQGYNSITNQAGYAFVSTYNLSATQPQYVVDNWTALTPSTVYANYSNGNQPFFITNYQLGTTVNIGLYYDNVGINYYIVVADGANVWTIFSDALPIAESDNPKLWIDQLTGIAYITSTTPTNYTLRAGSAPTLTDGVPSWIGITFSPINVYLNNTLATGDLMLAADPYYLNVIYAVYNTILYIGYYNSTANAIFLRQWDWDLETPTAYYRYIMMPYGYFVQTAYAGNQINITKYVLSTFSINTVPAVITYGNPAVQFYGISKSTRDNRLYISITGQINRYSLTTFEYKTTEPNIYITGLGSTSTITSTELIPPPLPALAVYNMGTYISAFNLCLSSIYEQLKSQIPSIPIATAPFFTLDYNTKLLTLNYDPQYSLPANGIYVNTTLLRYANFSTVIGDGALSGLNRYVLPSTGTLTQNKATMFLLNTVDKLIIVTNMSMLTDYTGLDKQITTFTDLDIDTTITGFFNMDGSFLYSAILLRKYDLVSNQSLRSISYQIYVQYLNGDEIEYQIPVGQNVSLKFEFDRIY